MKRLVPRNDATLSIVVPCFNEDAVLHATHDRLVSVAERIGVSFEILYVDDGSVDATPELLETIQESDERVRVVHLSRNFGHQVAITAGLEHACGQCVVLIDADLQDPPEVIEEMVVLWREGWDVAYGVRTDREGETAFKLQTAKAFYRILNALSNIPIPMDTGDFRLMDRAVVEALLAMPERDRFLRGMVSWLGFRQVGVPYRRAARCAGTTKYPLLKMVRFAMDGVMSFSIAPLRVASLLGFATSFLALLGGLVALWSRAWTNHWVTGWTSLFLAILFMGGVQLICVGIIGEYIGRIYGEAKRRPLYFVERRLGFDRRECASPTVLAARVGR